MSFRTYKGNSRSENGWPICDVNECYLPAQELSFMNAAWIRKGTAGLILEAWLRWYDANVPGEIASTVWGWSRENDVANSNHLSGTALDINAPQYPFHGNVMATRYPDRFATIERGLELFEGNIFWGAYWTSSRDEMHFQLADGTVDGMDASERLRDFVARKCPKGKLLDGPTEPPGEAEFLRRTDDTLIDIAGQLGAWPQLGNRTPVDALSKWFDNIQPYLGRL